MGALTAFFDASSAPDQVKNKALVVAGFVASEENWRDFEPRWQSVLDNAGVACLHMSELINYSGEFVKWKNRPGKREQFLSDLCDIVVDTVTNTITAISA